MIKIKTENYDFEYPDIQYIISQVDPIIEVKRYLLMYFNVVKHIMNVFAINNISIVSKQRNPIDLVKMRIADFIFLYHSEKHKKMPDGLFPFNYKNTKTFVQSILDLVVTRKLTKEETEKIVNDNINLCDTFNKCIEELAIFVKDFVINKNGEQIKIKNKSKIYKKKNIKKKYF